MVRLGSRFARGTTRVTVVVTLALALALPAVADGPLGHLVLIGGGGEPRPVVEKFVELAGGRDAPIVVFPTASERRRTGREYLEMFREEYGCSNVTVAPVKTRADALSPELAALVEQAGGVFFSGGDQSRITRALLGTPLEGALRRAFARGAAVAGTSAGTACMSDPMITGEGDFSVLTAANVELVPGLGLFARVIVDQHFVARQRQNRLISVVLEHPDLLGVGVDERTAVWVRPDRTFEVLGEGWVMVFDAVAAEIRRQPGRRGEALGVRGLVTHVLLPGEVFDLDSRRVVDR
jgi:cyanophycinase